MKSWLFEVFSIPLENASSLAIQEENLLYSYQDLSLKVEEKAKDFKRQGITPGVRVSFVAENSLSYVIAFLALLSLQASPCLLSARLPTESLPYFFKKARISFFLNTTLQVTKIDSYPALPEMILLFTSGSTGEPKLACLHLKHFLASAKGSITSLGLDQAPGKWLLSVPLFHVSGLSILFRCLISKSAVLIKTPLSLATHISFVPTQLQRLLQNPISLPFLKCLLLGGAPLSSSLIESALLNNIPVFTTYGLTETASQVTLSIATPNPQLGKALPGRELSIDPSGEILVRGKTLFLGYDSGNGPELPLTENGWFATKDLGSLTPEGDLFFKGRKDNLFISGGENIHPEEIEKALNTIPEVLFSAVVPIPDEEFGERPVAFIHMLKELPATEFFQDYLSTFLPKFCIPIRFWPFPPESLKQLKINRKELKQLAIKTIHSQLK